MFNVCPNCGEYRADKAIDPAGPFAVCPACGYRHPFRRLPLLIVGGASGSGKTALCQELTGRVTEAVLLDSDLLWRAEFDRPETSYREFFELWLLVAKNIGQSGRPVVLFGAGAGVPGNVEPCVERRYFSAVRYLALVCDEAVLASRLRARPAWRRCSQEFIERQITFNRWFREQGPLGDPPVTLLDTSATSPAEAAAALARWIRAHVTEPAGSPAQTAACIEVPGSASSACSVVKGPPAVVAVEPMAPTDWEAVRAIYLQGIAGGNATFERDAPAWPDWDAGHLSTCRLVARSAGRVVGWAALQPVSSRCVYGGVAEVSVYVDEAIRGRGVGRALLEAVVLESERAGIWTLQAGIFPQNTASLALHRDCGFREVGRRERLGQIDGAWRDVVLLERRSPVVGA